MYAREDTSSATFTSIWFASPNTGAESSQARCSPDVSRSWARCVPTSKPSCAKVAGFGLSQLTKAKPAVEVVDGPEQRAAVQEASKAAIEQIFAYRSDAAETHSKSVTTLMTKDYGAEFLQKIPSFDKLAGASVDTKVVGTGVVSMSATDASMLVFMNRTVSRPSVGPVYEGSRIVLGLAHFGDKWLISEITAV